MLVVGGGILSCRSLFLIALFSFSSLVLNCFLLMVVCCGHNKGWGFRREGREGKHLGTGGWMGGGGDDDEM
ncbi:hypothetical protein B0T21DRAFT_375669 [Apiosordaria backusii]|uniref:Transmembrane protein n=1 Tax=Apiosordaria backusii TaxID=314023 RepID=A0AA40AEH5_9PEZI|nr:hypothetical protein B0T21DRAFT_375669 [Apiosordaria backusii]